MGDIEKYIQERPFGEMGIWACLFLLAQEIDKLKGPIYGPMIEDEEE